MAHTIVVSESLFALLKEEARRNQVSPDNLAEQLLAERLQAERQKWQADFEKLLARVHSHMTGADPAQIEADITAASEEAKAEHRARRRSD